jgi:hypothetical protein
VLVPIAFFAAVMAVCWLLTKLKRNSSMRDAPFVAFISKTAVYLHGNVYLLTGGLGTFAEVKLVTGQPSRMEFRFRQTTQTGDRYFACAVPVPPGAEAVAEKVTAALRREYPSTIANSNG